MSNIKVVGITDQQFAFIASQTRKFKINETLIIEDETLGNVKVEVIQTQSFNKYIPMTSEKSNFVDSSVLETLKQIGYEIDNAETNVAKVRALEEQMYPITTGSNVRAPFFPEVESLFIKDPRGLNLGVIRGTEEITETMPEELQNLSLLFKRGQGRNSYTPLTGVPLLFDYRSMSEYPHIGIFGGSGSGKSYCLRVMLEELMAKRVPTVVFDPHFEMEFGRKSEDLPHGYHKDFSNKYIVLNIGKEVGIDFSNITAGEFASILGNSSETFSENMDNTVRMLFQPKETAEFFNIKLMVMIEYTENEEAFKERLQNKDNAKGRDRDYLVAAEEIVKTYGNKSFNYASLKAVKARFNRLLRMGIFAAGIAPVLDGLKQHKLVVIRGSISHLQIFSSYVLQTCYYKRKSFKDSEFQGDEVTENFPPFVIATDECHNFAPKGTSTPSKFIITEIAQEGRKYGTFLVLATQRPALLDDTIIAQLNSKFLFRTVRGQDIKLLSEETDLTQNDANRLPYMTSGECFMSSATMGRTIAVKIRAALTVPPNNKNPFEELEESFSANPVTEYLLGRLPFDTKDLTNILRDMQNEVGCICQVSEALVYLNDLCENRRIEIKKTFLGDRFLPL